MTALNIENNGKFTIKKMHTDLLFSALHIHDLKFFPKREKYQNFWHGYVLGRERDQFLKM